MAKKRSRKAVKKKPVKKKPVKRKPVKKKPVKKKPVKKIPAKKKPASQEPTGGGTRFGVPADLIIEYLCDNGCRQDPPRPHMGPGEIVVLRAVNTDVTINFPNGSPFESGANAIALSSGESRTEVVAEDVVYKHYGVMLTCPDCPPATGVEPKVPPEMIVP